MENTNNKETQQPENDNRREALTKLGKFAAYVAPFTVLAINAKAASGAGPGPHSKPGGSAH
jgi:hypothetical protein